jgi:hypothetical protein
MLLSVLKKPLLENPCQSISSPDSCTEPKILCRLADRMIVGINPEGANARRIPARQRPEVGNDPALPKEGVGVAICNA